MKKRQLKNIITILTGLLILTACTGKKDKSIRILTGGISHESNTFNPILTTEDYFNIKRGNDVLVDEEWADYLLEAGVEVIPTLHANANPFGVVASVTYESFKNEIIQGARNAIEEGELDGIYLDMHGALHVEGLADAQVDLVKSIREIVGEEVLIAGSFDLHGNMSEEFVDQLDILTAYRTAPHVDGLETRLRTVTLLVEAIENDYQPVITHIKVPILIPGEKGITSVEPLRSLYSHLQIVADKEGLMDASVFVGMPWTDVNRAGMSIQVVAESANYTEEAEIEANRLSELLWSKRQELVFDVPTASIEGAIQFALASTENTVFISDSGDNTTAGAAGDNTLVLKHLLSRRVADAVVAGIVDPEAVEACESAGVGAEVNLTIGGKLDTQFGEPLEINGIVRFISSGINPEFPRRKPVVVELDGVLLVLLNEVRSFTSPADFEEVGINPLDHKIVVVKLGYLFQELRDIAPKAIMALTPGFANQVIENLPYKNIPRPIYPMDKDMVWKAE
jgi:microcystin degradation protein MlrC